MTAVPGAFPESFARLVNLLSDDMMRRLAADLARIDLSDVAAARDAAIELMQLYCGGYTDYAAVIAAQFYDGLAERMAGAAPHAVADSSYDPEAVAGGVRAIMQDVVEGKPREAWERDMLDRADKEVRNAADSCVALNADRDGVRWARVPTGAVSCEFCIMLASRGAVYHEPELAAAGHANCDCRVVPDFGDGIEGYDPDLYYDMWKRPEDYPELQEARRARRRELYAEKHADGRAGEDYLRRPESFGTFIDTDGMGAMKPSILNAQTEKLDELIGKYDILAEVAARDGIAVRGKVINGIANSRYDTEDGRWVINLNPQAFDSAAHFNENVWDGIKSGFFMPAAKGKRREYPMAHEVGHILQKELIRRERGRFSSREYAASAEEHKRELLEIADELGIGTGDHVSRYANERPVDFFAECFANLECGRMNVYGKAMKVFLERRGVHVV